MLRYVPLSNGSVFDIIHPASLTMTATLAVVLHLAVGLAGVKIYNGVYSYGSFDESWRAGGCFDAGAPTAFSFCG